MKLVNKIKDSLFGKTIETHEVPKYEETESNAIEEKASRVYGEEKLARQQLFEKWSVKEEWLLKKEAIPLVFGFDPDKKSWAGDEDIIKRMDDLFKHAKTCIDHEMSLSVIDKTQNENDWQVKPTEFYCWASVSRVDVPEQLSALMEFILSTVKRTGFVSDKEGVEEIAPEAAGLSQQFNQDTEKVLGAALSLLMKQPEDCKNSKGRVDINKTVTLILEKRETWFGDKEPALSQSAMEDLLKKWKASLG